MPLEDVYRTEARFLEHLQIQHANVTTYKSEINAIDPDDIDSIKNDMENMEFLIETCNNSTAFKKTANEIKGRFFSGKTTPACGAFPPPIATTAPHDLLAGAVARGRERDQRFLHVAGGISDGAKAGMDLNGPGLDGPDLATFKPTFEASPAAMNYEFGVTVAGREGSDRWQVWVRTKGGNWTLLDSATGKAASFTYPGSGDDPIVLDIRIQLIKDNEDYGQPSDIQSVTLNP